jgi:hypothetical protein
MHRSLHYLVALAAAALAAVAGDARADEFDLTAREFAAQIAAAKDTIANWDLQARWLVGVATTVGVLGAAIALLQQLGRRRWMSVTIAVVGFMITALTVFTSNFFDADHKTYRKSAQLARRHVVLAETYLDRLAKEPDIEAKRALAADIATKIASVEELENRILDPARVAQSLPGIRSAHAQVPGRPGWIVQPRGETATTHRFVASAANRSLTQAQAESLQNAQRSAASALAIPLDSVQRYGRTVDSYMEYDAAQKSYRVYTLVEINKALARR